MNVRRLSGIRVERVKLMVFMIMGAMCALSGIVLSGTLNSAEPTAGSGYEMDVIAAVVIGGRASREAKALSSGHYRRGPHGVLRKRLRPAGISAYWQTVSIGVVIIAAVALDSIKSKKKS
jgi:ribose transport system permease protein